MAEAIVDGTSSMSRFFCHRCSVEIEHLLPDYTCPRCSTGFIEKLERSSAESGSGMDIDNQDLSDIEFPGPFHLPLALLGETTGVSRNPRNGGNVTRRRSHQPQDLDLQTTPRNTSSRNQQQENLLPQIDSLIQDIFANLAGIGFGFQPGQGPVLFLGNPGDYVWGQHGLDSIVTQLLNQMDETGAPPLPKKKIEEIPTTIVSQTQIDCKLQCSVCWEDFILEESVRQLPCQHLYHAPCIVPWLELHGTCPICRQSLGDQSTFDANQDTVGPSLAALFRAANESSSSRTSSASLGSSSRNDSPNEL